MSETPTGTDRVELTEDERAQMNCDCADPYAWDDHVDSCTVPVVESIVAARAQALTAERDFERSRCASLAKTADAYMAERDAARAELAAANARNRELEREIDERDKAHEGIVATITSAARADTRTAKSDAAKVQMLAERVDALTLSRDKHRNRADALQARCAELEEEVMAHQVSDGYTKGYEHGTLTTTKFKAERDALQAEIEVNDQYHDHDIETGVQFMRERDALQATLDRVVALADEWEASAARTQTEIDTWATDYEKPLFAEHRDSLLRRVADLRAALTPEGKP